MDRVQQWLADCPRHPPAPSFSNEGGSVVSRENDSWLVKCHSCGYSVTEQDAIDNRAVAILGRVYHKDHVSCGRCRIPIFDEHYGSKATGPICQDCYAIEKCPPCAGCGHPTAPKAVRFNGHYWHRDCIRCALCNNSIGQFCCEFRGRFFDEDCLRVTLYGVPRSCSSHESAGGGSSVNDI